MPRNLRGGKAYKKKKKPVAGGAAEGAVERFVGVDREQGVDYARVLRALGNRRMLCFCNDGMERVCKIRGALCKGPKRKIIEIGDIVAVSYRSYTGADDSDMTDSSDEEEATAGITTAANRGGGSASEMTPTAAAATLDSGRKDVGDIIHKYDSRNWREIRKAGGIHPQLFAAVTTTVEGAAGGAGDDDDIFEERGDEVEEGEGDGDSGSGSDLDVDAI